MIIIGTKRNVVFLIAYLCIVRSAFYNIEHCKDQFRLTQPVYIYIFLHTYVATIVTYPEVCNIVYWISLLLFSDLVDDYQAPFFEWTNEEPTVDEMKEVVIVDRHRPPIPERWSTDQVNVYGSQVCLFLPAFVTRRPTN